MATTNSIHENNIHIHHQVEDIQIVLEPQDTPETFIIVDQKTNVQLGRLQQGPQSPHSIELFSGKGGLMAIISSPLGIKYFALQGSKIKVGHTTLELFGSQLSANQNREESHVSPITPQTHSHQATILGAGLATRFERISGDTTNYSKPAVPLTGNKSVIECIANSLAVHGFNKIIVNTYFKPESLKASLSRCENAQVSYIDEAEPSGTAGGLRKMLMDAPFKPLLNPMEPLLVVQGDSVSDANFSELMEAHITHQALLTIGCQLVAEKDVDKFGIIVTDQSGPDGQSGKIVAFQEKPKQEEALSRLGNTGFYIFSPKALSLIPDIYSDLLKTAQEKARKDNAPLPDEISIDFASDLFPVLLKLSQQQPGLGPVWAQTVQGYWNDIGNPAQYIETLHDLYAGKTTLPLPTNRDEYYRDGIIYWEGAAKIADQESAQLSGNIVVARPFQTENAS
ncbi:NDP-sugar synthase [Vampirovibrio sp.]|uniref:nucleotidyltransferase family protein n=1 Tax=Vampirovibrio sp. TaxID=2717857 RepID=UPI00359338AB